ncbi:MAG: lysylphosphatidylglycerol synthase transmembrane domain-containing protein [bacterium]|nr:lysylphosphatidylglycerol synthase transmembrane domain-containing protein [bacterium]
MRISKIFLPLLFLGGAALLAAMIWQVGLQSLFESFQSMGVWLVPYMILKGVRIVMHTVAWRSCFPGNCLHVPFWHLLLVSRAGGAINQVTPSASVGGEVVKVLLLESHLPREQASAIVIINKASSTIAKMLYLTLGMFYLTQRLPLPIELYLSLTLTIGLITLGLIGFVAFQRYGLFSRLLGCLGRFRFGQKRIQRLRKHLMPIEAQLVAYYTHYGWRFVRSIGMHFVADAFSVVKIYVLLRLLLASNAPSFADAVTVAVAVAALDQMFFFVPGRLGTLEGARFMVLSLLGIAQVYGLTFGIVARLEQLFWSGVGFLAYGIYTRYVVPGMVQQPVKASLSS